MKSEGSLGEFPFRSIPEIADDRMATVGELNPNLMMTAGMQIDFYPGHIIPPIQTTKEQFRLLSVPPPRNMAGHAMS